MGERLILRFVMVIACCALIATLASAESAAELAGGCCVEDSRAHARIASGCSNKPGRPGQTDLEGSFSLGICAGSPADCVAANRAE